ARLALTFVTAGDCVTLPFRATELDAATLLIDGVAPTASQATATSLKVCGAGRDAGATMTLDTDQTVPLATLADSQVGYSIRTDGSTAHNPFSYLVSWVGGCDRFGPCDSRPDQFAT
ncbi:MAG: hypothetical protein NT062_14340, partial [Proteobacteria bacterium]|nr:hypothetical protein [Pseudomonadota bacterium]